MPGGLTVPASVRAGWPNGNYVNPTLQDHWAPIIIAVLAVLAAIIVVARYVSRFRLQSNAGIDDWIFLAAMPGVLGLTIGVILADTKLHSGLHIWDMKSSYIAPMRKLQLSNYCCYVYATCLIKVSVLAFYRRLTDSSISPRFVWALRLTILANLVFFIASIITVCFPCYPMRVYWEGYWNQARFAAAHPGLKWHCLDEGKAVYYVSMIGTVLDIITTVLPFSLFLRLRMPRRQKVAMCCTFAGGFMVCAAAAARTWAAHQVYFDSYDMTWDNYYFWFTTGLEVLVAVMCASAPSLKFYFRRYLDVPETRMDPNSEAGRDSRTGLLSSRKKRKDSSWSTGSRKSDMKSYMTSMSTSHARSPRANMDAEKQDYFSVLSSVPNGHGATDGNLLSPPDMGNPFATPQQLGQTEWAQLEGEIVRDWHHRSKAAQVDELMATGVIARGAPAPKLPTMGEHPVYYPWQDTQPVVDEELRDVRI